MITVPNLCLEPPSEIDMFVRQLATRALERSAAAPYVDAAVYRGYLTLTGCVRSKFDKVDAERCVAGVPGVRGVLNRIEVAA
jgi:osmotically-inducible protein OsmY